jgi:hypothetical protein
VDTPGLAKPPEKRKVGGSTPPLTTSQLATCGPVTRLNVSRRWICSASLVTVTARSRPSFSACWGTRRVRPMILSVRLANGIGLFVPKPSTGRGCQQRCTSGLGQTVRGCSLASTADGGDCHSLGHSVVRRRWPPVAADGAHGPLLPDRCPSLPARDGRPGCRHRRALDELVQAASLVSGEPPPTRVACGQDEPDSRADGVSATRPAPGDRTCWFSGPSQRPRPLAGL